MMVLLGRKSRMILNVWTLTFFALSAASFGVAETTGTTVDAARVFELRIYHAVPGKLAVMESRFRDQTSKILARHNLHVVGYWVTADEKNSSFVFLLAHRSREEADKNWAAFRADPEFQEVVKAEQTEKTLEKADIIWLRATEFSPMR